MGRIVYFIYSNDTIQGGQKMAIRHVETLRDLGFDAVCRPSGGSIAPTWLNHRLHLEFDSPVSPDDVVVAPEDAGKTLGAIARLPNRLVILAQNPFTLATRAIDEVDRFAPNRSASFITVGPRIAATIQRAFPQTPVDLVPCFADERLFRPAADRRPAIAFSPRKRPYEARVIRKFFERFYPERGDIAWTELSGVSEARMAEAFGQSTLHLSLSRLESVGMTTLEAMAAGCVCAGFTGVGGREYATAENGFWVPDEDCEAAVEALAQADDLVRTGGSPLAHHLEAARATAQQWSYARFRLALEEVWSRLAPETRLRSGPLD